MEVLFDKIKRTVLVVYGIKYMINLHVLSFIQSNQEKILFTPDLFLVLPPIAGPPPHPSGPPVLDEDP